MRSVVDPTLVSVGSIGWAFLAFTCLLLPLGAFLQHRQFEAGAPMPDAMRLYVGVLSTHAVLLAMVVGVAVQSDLALLPAYRPSTWHLLLGAGSLALGLLPALKRFRITSDLGESRARLMAPRTPREHVVMYAVCVSAGVTEQLAYRGVLFTLLAALLGGWWVPALLASAAFGIVHLFQGWRSAGLVVLVALRDHIVVGLTGTLFVAIVVHMLHDAIFGTVSSRRVRRDERAVEAAAEGARAIS